MSSFGECLLESANNGQAHRLLVATSSSASIKRMPILARFPFFFYVFYYVAAISPSIAGEGNRTPVCSLGSCRSAIELHPRSETFDFRFSKPTIIGSPNQFKVYSFRDCRLQPKQIVRANRLFTLGAVACAVLGASSRNRKSCSAEDSGHYTSATITARKSRRRRN